MILLAIETSCDETAAAVLKDRSQILSSVVLSQDSIHAPYGGVVPELASRQHITSIGYVVQEAVQKAKLKIEQVEAYAVTQGPGLIGSLLVGLSFAKGLAFYFRKPLVAVDHIEAHIQSVFLEYRDVEFPVLALVVSGGHTSLFFMKEKLDYELVGRTRDDAAGEALDKIAKHLGLGYPGGPVIDRLAEKGDPAKYPFGIPHMTDKSLDFSFSGIKTAALKHIKEHGIKKENAPLFYDFLASFQNGVVQALLSNLQKATDIYRPRSLILCGGVARNKKLRSDFTALAGQAGLNSFVPSGKFCTDNAAMVASLACERLLSGKVPTDSLDLNAYPRRS